MAAANWNLSPGAGSQQAEASARTGIAAAAAENEPTKDLALYESSLKALEDLADALPDFMTRLKSKADLDARQRVLSQSGGSIEQTGSGDQVQLRVSERIGEGTFCVVYKAELLPKNLLDTQTKEVAAKFELRKTDSTQLRNEFRMYKKLQHCPGVAQIYSFGEMDFHKVLVMDLLGPSLESYFQDCGRRFSIKTVCMLAKQMISRVQAIHEHDLIYRDIKPENFLMGIPSSDTANMVHLIDYGMAKVYRDTETNKHIPYGEAQSMSGTARYMSINAHRRCTQSRRDDLEALGHVFLYFLRGNLPWQGVKALQNDQRYDQMCEKKQATTIEDLCRGYPPEFAEYLTYTRSLSFDGDPDYDHMRSLFVEVLDAQGDVDDNMYDWIKTSGPQHTPEPALKPSKTLPVTITPPKSETPLPPQPHSAPQATAVPSSVPNTVPNTVQNTQSAKIDSTSEPPRPITPQHAVSQPAPPAAVIAPASPPGVKRGRAEFASELRPPTRSRPKRPVRTFYDSEAQRALVTLYREVMAKRYAFHRAVKQSRSVIVSGTTAAAAATAALIARTSRMTGPYGRQMAPARAVAPAVIAQTFTDNLDKTLGKVINELEEMSDRMLQDGDWSGAPRVQAWLEEADTAARKETQRIRLEMEEERKKQEERREKELAPAPQSDAATVTPTPRPSASADSLYSYPHSYLYPSALRQPGQQHGQRPGGRVLIDIDPLEADKPRPGSQQRLYQSEIDMTPLEALEVDDNPEQEDEFRIAEMDLRARYSRRGTGSGYAAGGFAEDRQPLSEPMMPVQTTASVVPAPPVAAAAASGPSVQTPSATISIDIETPTPIVPDLEPVEPAIPTIEAAPPDTPHIDSVAAPVPAPDFPRVSPSAAVRTGINDLSIGADHIAIDSTIDTDDDDDSDDDEPIELVYRTASGTRKVMQAPHRG